MGLDIQVGSLPCLAGDAGCPLGTGMGCLWECPPVASSAWGLDFLPGKAPGRSRQKLWSFRDQCAITGSRTWRQFSL